MLIEAFHFNMVRLVLQYSLHNTIWVTFPSKSKKDIEK